MGGMISLNAALQNAIAKLGLRKVVDLPKYDMLSWMCEALGQIGTMEAVEETCKEVEVSNYIGKFPQDLYAPIRVKDRPMRSMRGGFTTNLEIGIVTLEYKRFVRGEDGMLMIPNEPSVLEALTWFCAKYLSVQGVLPNKSLGVDYCDMMWLRYCRQARANGFMPTLDEAERMVNIYKRLIPLENEYENEFRGSEHREHLDLGNTIGGTYNGR